MIRNVLVTDAVSAVEYALDHVHPCYGVCDEPDNTAAQDGLSPMRAREDRYAVISLQDASSDGFGFRFVENRCCTGVLTLLVDDIEQEVSASGAVLFSPEMAHQVIDFIRRMDASEPETETLLVHCYGGWSRSRAVGAFACEMLAMDSEVHFKEGDPNRHIYDTLIEAWESEPEDSF